MSPVMVVCFAFVLRFRLSSNDIRDAHRYTFHFRGCLHFAQPEPPNSFVCLLNLFIALLHASGKYKETRPDVQMDFCGRRSFDNRRWISYCTSLLACLPPRISSGPECVCKAVVDVGFL